MPRLTLLSNGHGEDAIGAQLATQLRRLRPDLIVQAYPTVDSGSAYERADLKILGPRRTMPSGGLLLHSPALLWRDLKAGFVPMMLTQWRDLARLETDVLVVVGDIYAQLLSALVATRVRFVYQPLVSAWHSRGRRRGGGLRLFMEVITPPERALMRRLADRIYVRDQLTESYLRSRGVPHARALGNPMLDAIQGRPIEALAEEACVVALLPGTRRYASGALTLMLASLARAPKLTGLLAWSGGQLPSCEGWRWRRSPQEPGVLGILARGHQKVWVTEGRFADVLASAHLALGTAGTANEQAAAWGLPVVSFPFLPDYTPAFLDNQRRLLGSALTVARSDPQSVADRLLRLCQDLDAYLVASKAGPRRMGRPGGAAAIARDLLDRAEVLGVLPPAARG